MTTLITGATSGLGLATARHLRRRGEPLLIAGRDRARTARVAAQLGAGAVMLDLRDLDAVRRTAESLPPVDVLICNAGVQVVRGQTFTDDGFEETFAVNHLAHLALADILLARDRPPRQVVLIGSATHDPAVRTGTPDPSDAAPMATLARPEPDRDSARTAGMRRYTTSKLLAAATAAGLAREHPGVHVSTFDPGLMPATGLGRQAPAPVRLLLRTVLRGLRVLPFASSAGASGRALATLVTEQPPPVPSGAYVDHRLRTVPASARARDTDYQDAVLAETRELLKTSD